MKTGYIRFSETNTIEVKLVDGTVWMTINEIADLFGVNVPAINNQQRRIFKDNLLKENEVTKEHRYTCPKHGECIRVYYNLEVIIFLGFRIDTLYTRIFREWVFSSLRKSNSDFIDCGLIIKEYFSFNLN